MASHATGQAAEALAAKKARLEADVNELEKRVRCDDTVTTTDERSARLRPLPRLQVYLLGRSLMFSFSLFSMFFLSPSTNHMNGDGDWIVIFSHAWHPRIM